MEKLNKFINKTKKSYKSLPDKKQYIEVFTAALTVPVLLTVIIINLNNLRSTSKPTQVTPAPVQDRQIIVNYPTASANTIVTQPSTGACKQAVGPISIDYPNENETITDNPVQIEINYVRGDYCAVVWAYRINDGKFSGYDDKSIALYNPPQGSTRFQLKVKSIVTGEETILTRTFMYKGVFDILPTASSSAN